MGIADMNFLPYCFLADTNNKKLIPGIAARDRFT